MSIKFPTSWSSSSWYNGTRHEFEIDGHTAWIVEPHQPARDGRWSWVTIWPEAFVPRVGVVELLNQGYYHAHIDVLATRANPQEGIPVMRKFYQTCVDLGLARQVNLIGMSWGGFFALRFAAENPEKVACIYLDAPLCNMGDDSTPSALKWREQMATSYQIPEAQLVTYPLNPINNMQPIVRAGIPLFAAVGEQDMVVNVAENFDRIEAAVHAAGGTIKVIRRPSWGHHPHGFDDPSELVAFMNFYAAGQHRNHTAK